MRVTSNTRITLDENNKTKGLPLGKGAERRGLTGEVKLEHA